MVGFRRAHEAVAGRSEDDDYPAPSLIERRLQEIEDNNPQPESLQDVPSAAECSADKGELALNPDGTFRLKQRTKQVQMLSDSEELRRRVRILGTSYEIGKLKNPTREWLASQSKEMWWEHLDFVLGPKVYGLRMGSESSGFRPPWQAVLNFEFALRKAALWLVGYDGHDLVASFVKARNDTELRESKFITPLLLVHTLAPSYGPSRLAPPLPSQELPYPKGKGAKGGWKGRGRGRGKAGKGSFRMDPGLPVTTPEGKSICFAHNNTGEMQKRKIMQMGARVPKMLCQRPYDL